MIKDKAFYAALEKAAKTLSRGGKGRGGSHHALLCASVSDLESLVDAYLNADMNYMRTGLIVGISPKMATFRIKILIEMGVKFENFPQRAASSHPHAEEIAKLYSEGCNHEQIGRICNLSRSTINVYLRKLRELGLLNIEEDKREKGSLKRRCALHLSDLYRHHSYRVRAKIAA